MIDNGKQLTHRGMRTWWHWANYETVPLISLHDNIFYCYPREWSHARLKDPQVQQILHSAGLKFAPYMSTREVFFRAPGQVSGSGRSPARANHKRYILRTTPGKLADAEEPISIALLNILLQNRLPRAPQILELENPALIAAQIDLKKALWETPLLREPRKRSPYDDRRVTARDD